MTHLALFATLAFLVSLATTPLVKWISRRYGVLDVPNERSSHHLPTARSGGVAILAGMLVALGASRTITSWPWHVAVLAIVFVAALGQVDDVRHLGAATRLVAQCAAALFTILAGDFVIRSIDVPWNGGIGMGMAAIPLTVIYIVGLTNAYNFMDGINGIASLEAIVAGTTLAVLFVQAGDVAGAIFAAVTAAAAAGFLPWNFPSASIFMGDVGSGALGMTFALLSIRYAIEGHSIVAPLLPLMPFIADTAVTLLRRMARRERVHIAHRSHFYQRLNQLGWSHAGVSLLWSGMAAAGGGIAVMYGSMGSLARTMAVMALIGIHLLTGIAITLAEGRRLLAR